MVGGFEVICVCQKRDERMRRRERADRHEVQRDERLEIGQTGSRHEYRNRMYVPTERYAGVVVNKSASNATSMTSSQALRLQSASKPHATGSEIPRLRERCSIGLRGFAERRDVTNHAPEARSLLDFAPSLPPQSRIEVRISTGPVPRLLVQQTLAQSLVAVERNHAVLLRG